MSGPDEWNEESEDAGMQWRRADEQEWTPPPGISDWSPKDYVILEEGARPIPVTDPMIRRNRLRRIVYVSSGGFIAIGLLLMASRAITPRSSPTSQQLITDAPTEETDNESYFRTSKFAPHGDLGTAFETFVEMEAHASKALLAGDSGRALVLYKQLAASAAIPADPKEKADFLFNYAAAAILRGEEKLALELCRQFIDLTPDGGNGEVFNNYAVLLLRQGGDVSLAFESVNKALAISPENPSFLDTLGCIQKRRGDFENAIRTFDKAIALSEGVVNGWQIHEHLGDAYLMAGNSEMALLNWRKAVVKNFMDQRLWKKIRENSP